MKKKVFFTEFLALVIEYWVNKKLKKSNNDWKLKFSEKCCTKISKKLNFF
jgi:hypothetical protein